MADLKISGGMLTAILAFTVQAVLVGIAIGKLWNDVQTLKERPEVIERITRLEVNQDHMKQDIATFQNGRSKASPAAASLAAP